MKQKRPILSSQPHFTKLQALLVAGVLAIVGLMLLLSTRAAVHQLYLTPNDGSIPVGQTFSLDLRMNSGTTPVNAVEAYVAYPVDQFELVSSSTDGGVFDINAPSSGVAAGIITISRGRVGGIAGDHKIATFTFRSLKAGNAGVALSRTSQLLSAIDNKNIIGSLGHALYQVGDVAAAPVPAPTPVPAPAPTPPPAPEPISPVPDATPPVVGITAPADGSRLRRNGKSVIAASATDDIEVSRMEVLVDGTIYATVLGDAISVGWNTRKIRAGSHSITVRAYDIAGNVGTRTITVRK